MVNAGAIATTSLVPARRRREMAVHRRRPVAFRRPHLASTTRSTPRRRPRTTATARSSTLLDATAGRLRPRRGARPVHPPELAACHGADLAVMGATLADGGVNPLTGERVVDAASCRCALAVMATAGLYETSGDWLYDIGLPGKSGIGGGIVTVVAGQGWSRHVRATPRRRRQQRQGPTRRRAPLPTARSRPVPLGTGAARVMPACGACPATCWRIPSTRCRSRRQRRAASAGFVPLWCGSAKATRIVAGETLVEGVIDRLGAVTV